MACRSEKDARQAGVIFAVTQVLFRSLIWLPIGVGLLILFPPDPAWSDTVMASKTESSFVRGIAELLPVGARGLMITGMLGALASTVDTHLNWGSSYFTNDLYKRFIAKHLLKKEPSPRSLVWVARISNFGILAIALAILPLMDSIQMAWKASLLLGAGVGVLLILRWLWWRMNAMGELMALVGSLVYAPVLLLWVDAPLLTSWGFTVDVDGARLLLMAVLATSTGIAAALLTKAEDPDLLKQFYERTQPPGYWGPVSENTEYDRYRLWVNVFLALGGGCTIFLTLTGVAALLLGSPAPSWLPSKGVFIALNLGAAVLLLALLVRVNRSRIKRGKAETVDEPR